MLKQAVIFFAKPLLALPFCFLLVGSVWGQSAPASASPVKDDGIVIALEDFPGKMDPKDQPLLSQGRDWIRVRSEVGLKKVQVSQLDGGIVTEQTCQGQESCRLVLPEGRCLVVLVITLVDGARRCRKLLRPAAN